MAELGHTRLAVTLYGAHGSGRREKKVKHVEDRKKRKKIYLYRFKQHIIQLVQYMRLEIRCIWLDTKFVALW